MDWLLRCANAVIHGEADFKHLHNTDRNTFETGLKKTVKHIHSVLNQISNKLGLDHDRVLFSKFSIPVLVRHLELCNSQLISASEWNLILYWYLQSGIHGRYSGTTSSKIRQDLEKLDGHLNGIEQLISDIGMSWGRSQALPVDFDAWSLGARTYPILYWLTRLGSSQNFCDGVNIKENLIGSQLNVHHIFPKAKLYEYGYSKPQVNAIGNFCFLTATCNQQIGASLPNNVDDNHKSYRIDQNGYFYWTQKNFSGALESQWIPMDEELWKIENYLDFLKARRQLLADATNNYLKSLNPHHPDTDSITEKPTDSQTHIDSVDEESQINEVQSWMESHQLSSGEFGYDLGQSQKDASRAIIDLAWPNGIREGLDRPMAILLNESAETYQIVNQAGYQCFTDIQSFKKYVVVEIIGI